MLFIIPRDHLADGHWFAILDMNVLYTLEYEHPLQCVCYLQHQRPCFFAKLFPCFILEQDSSSGVLV